MKKKLIEMVCKGNVGRSPVAELIARNYIQEVGASADYGVISSGTLVRRMQQADYSPEELKEFVETCREIGYQHSSIDNLDRALREGSPEAIDLIKRKFIDYLVQKETNDRDGLIRELGIKGTVKRTSDQTIARPDVIAVLPMDRENYARVLPVYDGSGYSPLISVLGILATGNPENEIKLDNVSLNQKDVKEAYKRRIEQMAEETPKAIRKIVST